METTEAHELRLEPHPQQTHGSCTCGHWERDADAAIVAVTGRSREDALRAAHELHARGLDGAPTSA